MLFFRCQSKSDLLLPYCSICREIIQTSSHCTSAALQKKLIQARQIVSGANSVVSKMNYPLDWLNLFLCKSMVFSSGMQLVVFHRHISDEFFQQIINFLCTCIT